LEKIQKKFPFKFINVIPNPRTFFRQDVCEAQVTCVFDEQTKKDVEKFPHSSEIICTGWFVRPQFEETYNKQSVRKELGLDPKLLTFLFVAGSEGTESILQPLDKIREISEIQIGIACGSNLNLLNKVQSIAEKSGAHIHAIPFSKEIHKYMQAADLVIGKAGPNMIFESIATHIPFFATTHISGLEDGNLNIIEKYKVGFVQENAEKAALEIKNIVEHPELLEPLIPNVKELAEYNKQQRKQLLPYLN
jgi:UDP-N-acetylglucosamine:LPS N-acetylglucosamine transferase